MGSQSSTCTLYYEKNSIINSKSTVQIRKNWTARGAVIKSLISQNFVV